MNKLKTGDYFSLKGMNQTQLNNLNSFAQSHGFTPLKKQTLKAATLNKYSIICACIDGGNNKVFTMGSLSSKTINHRKLP